jgi:SAM-dependent methyltransferase
MAVPTQPDVETRLAAEDLDEWLRLWHVEQGPAKPEALALMAGVIPMAPGARLRVLDLCCGPGDVGRAIRARFPNAEIDGVDRDLFLTSLCKVFNAREGVPGKIRRRDLETPGWDADLDGPYDVAAVGNALHWFTLQRAKALLAETLGLLKPGGVFLFTEPVSAMPQIAEAFEVWKAAQPAQHRREDWLAFWSRVNAFLDYEHFDLNGRPPTGRVGDGLTVVDWIALAREAGFASVDVVLRDSEKVVIAALKSQPR